jgi:hypothetical protein
MNMELARNDHCAFGGHLVMTLAGTAQAGFGE